MLKIVMFNEGIQDQESPPVEENTNLEKPRVTPTEASKTFLKDQENKLKGFGVSFAVGSLGLAVLAGINIAQKEYFAAAMFGVNSIVFGSIAVNQIKKDANE
jgi:hypothetical protein